MENLAIYFRCLSAKGNLGGVGAENCLVEEVVDVLPIASDISRLWDVLEGGLLKNV